MLARWIASQDAVVIHGYNNGWMLLAMLICKSRRVPYLLRCDSEPECLSKGIHRSIRNILARTAVSGSAGGLSIGQLNYEFYRRYGARKIIPAPYSVDDERFSRPPAVGRSQLLERWKLKDSRAVIMYCGKLYQGKRPLDLSAAVKILPEEVTVLFVGDGVLARQVRESLMPGCGVVTGFVNQSELPAYYHAADILVLPSEVEKWGLVVNEAMAAGVLPVVSDRVGAAPDLVSGVGEIYRCGDIADLAAALSRALAQVGEHQTRDRVRRHAAKHSMDLTATGFEEAAFAVSKG
jgi:glycosyltransferase involved in cell wall biosynthesis